MNCEGLFKVGISGKRGITSLAWDILACVREYMGSVFIEKDGRKVDAGSMVGILSLALANDDVIKVICYGKDEHAARLCIEKIGNAVGGVRLN